MKTKPRKPSIPIIPRVARAQITMEKGIPLPPNTYEGKSVFPFSEMKIGDSFSFPTLHEADRVQRQLTSVKGAARNYARVHNPKANFFARIDGKIIRVWRTADVKK